MEKWKIGFWNVAGLERKDKDFMRTLEQWEVVVMIEMWLDTKGQKRVRRRLPKGYRWNLQNVKRRNKKGRTIGGLVTRIKKEIMMMKKNLVEIGEETEGLTVEEVELGAKVGSQWGYM